MQQVRVISATYANEEAFIFYITNLAQNIIGQNPNVGSNDFMDKFQAQYEKDNVTEYNTPNLRKQIMNDSKYNVEIKSNKLSFKLKNFEFSNSFYYDPGTKKYIIWPLEMGSSVSPRQEAVRVKHTRDIVFEIGGVSSILDPSLETKKNHL
jgi:hypothetical protein